MKDSLYIKNGIEIPGHELEITTSRAEGPGGQHVNKSNTRVTVRWNVKTTHALTDEQKKRVLQNLENQLTSDGDLIIHAGNSRSQYQNKKIALENLAKKVRKGLYISKKRIPTPISEAAKQARLQEKKQISRKKKLRKVKDFDE